MGTLNWRELVQEEMGREVSLEECDFILWELTAYPFGDEGYIRKQIRELRDVEPREWIARRDEVIALAMKAERQREATTNDEDQP